MQSDSDTDYQPQEKPRGRGRGGRTRGRRGGRRRGSRTRGGGQETGTGAVQEPGRGNRGGRRPRARGAQGGQARGRRIRPVREGIIGREQPTDNGGQEQDTRERLQVLLLKKTFSSIKNLF